MGIVMEGEHESCNHRWQYYVDLHERAVTSRRCELCGLVAPMVGRKRRAETPARREPLRPAG